MDIDQFWGLIQKARVAAGPAADTAVRDFDEPDDDPNHDYWDFDELELDPEELAGLAHGQLDDDGDDDEDLDDEDDDDEDDEDDEEDEDDEDEDEDDEISDPIAIALISELERLPPAEIASFERIFEEQRARADRPDLANAALLIEHGFLGDDSFDDFRAGLVSLGRESFEGALAAPDSLATHPIVREIAQANDPRWVGREDLLYAAGHAYAAVTGEDEVTFYDFVEEQFPADDVEPDDVEDWEITDETATRGRLPRLADLFYERSMRNRARAIEKLGLAGAE